MKKYSLAIVGCFVMLLLSVNILKAQSARRSVPCTLPANSVVTDGTDIHSKLLNATEDVSKRTIFSSTYNTQDGNIIIKYSSFPLNYPDEKGIMQPLDKKAMSNPIVRGLTSKWMGGSTPSCSYPNYYIDSILVTVPAGMDITQFSVDYAYTTRDTITNEVYMNAGGFYFSTPCGRNPPSGYYQCDSSNPGICYLIPNNDLHIPLTTCLRHSCYPQSFWLDVGLTRVGYPGGCDTTDVWYSQYADTNYIFHFSAYVEGPSSVDTPTVSGFPKVITLGDSAYLTATIPLAATISWLPTSGLSCTTCANPMASPPVTTTYTVTITDSCRVFTDTATVFVANCSNNFNEPICVVTVDTATGNAEIIWGRTNSPPATGSYIVYKENSSSVFVPITTQALNALSEYVDPLSNPSLGPVSYKLATDDSCGESALSPVNTTINLYVNVDSNVVNILNWTPYVGFTPSKYRIYRGLSMGTLILLDSVPNTVLTYHDTLPPFGDIYLLEAVNPASACVPTTHIKGHNLTSTMLSGSFSNGYNSHFSTAIQNMITGNSILNIYPNPTSGSFTIAGLLQGQKIELYNYLGQKLNMLNATGNTMNIDISGKANGVYLIRILNKDGSFSAQKKIVKQ